MIKPHIWPNGLNTWRCAKDKNTFAPMGFGVTPKDAYDDYMETARLIGLDPIKRFYREWQKARVL